jgi:hypothetical protein
MARILGMSIHRSWSQARLVFHCAIVINVVDESKGFIIRFGSNRVVVIVSHARREPTTVFPGLPSLFCVIRCTNNNIVSIAAHAEQIKETRQEESETSSNSRKHNP